MKRLRIFSTTCLCCCAVGSGRLQTPSGCSMSVAADPAIEPPRLEPSLAQARELAERHNLIALRHSYVEDCETPVSAFLKLRELAPGEPAFLLESAEQGQRVGRYSFIGLRPRRVLRWSLGDGGPPYALAAQELARAVQAPIDD